MKEEEKKEKEKETEEKKEHQAARITHRPMKRFTRACFEDSYRLRLDTSSTTYDEGRRVHRFPLSSLRRSEVERCSIDSCHEAASTPRVGKILSRISLSCSLFICRLQIELVMSADSAADISEGRLDEPKSNTYRAAPPPEQNEDLFRILARHTRGSYKIYISPTYFEFVFVATRGRSVMDD